MYALLLYCYGGGIDMSEIKFSINGKDVTANAGETILNVARREDIYIPTMCYIKKTNPIASCRLCVVEVKDTEGFVLSCQTPVKDGISVNTESKELYTHRQNIMRFYDVNHPLECGVCDKSGACELQNKTLEFNINSQKFSAKEQSRKIEQWGLINYDPNLCIMCERCVHVCNEVIGDDAIDLKFGGYNSSVIPKNSDTLDCTFCGECVSVCPVGALVSSDFQYIANAWELSQVPSACTHCSAGCAIEYERRHTATFENNQSTIQRVTNDFENTTLCGAGRFGFDYDNKDVQKNQTALVSAQEALKKASTIAFNSIITNEEALILQQLKEKTGVKLYNSEAYNYKKFLTSYSQKTGKSLYSASLDTIEKSDAVIVFGTRIGTDNPAVRYKLTQAERHRKSRIAYLHPIHEELISNVAREFINYEVGSEEGVMALLLRSILEDNETPEIKSFIDDLDEGYLSAESNVGEDELETLFKSFKNSKNRVLVLGEDLLAHDHSENIAAMAGLIEKFSDYRVLIVPPSVNTLGVALICDLDENKDGYTVGYNTQGDFTLSALGNGDLDMPSLNQQEGTVTTIDKRVVPINVAASYDGYTLADVANINEKYTVELTAKLPIQKGFTSVDFDSLEVRVNQTGEDLRGYALESYSVETNNSIKDISDLDSYNGTIVYRANPVLQFNAFTAATKQLSSENILEGSEQFAKAARIKDGDFIEINSTDFKNSKVFKVNPKLKGTIALLPTFEEGLSSDWVSSRYRFFKVQITKVEQTT